ncbi:uncharacterized protein LOC126249110 [Schistocerca nitens]|uniref:uncharacterized protein LOC126249110 n=1 Tax=Schistocerca nitens TaxID=7011 RepID=UPI00211956B8|nr:uncharacterized protein LOC126249110 [Schistocerca nitens]
MGVRTAAVCVACPEMPATDRFSRLQLALLLLLATSSRAQQFAGPLLMEALDSIVRNDDLRCVPRLVCEFAAGSRSAQQLPFVNADFLLAILRVDGAEALESSPLLVLGRAALTGVAARGDPRPCFAAYPACPRDSDRLVYYLNNHNGGFFRFFRQPYGYGSAYRPGASWESQRELQETDGDAEGTRTGTGDLLLDAADLTRFQRPNSGKLLRFPYNSESPEHQHKPLGDTPYGEAHVFNNGDRGRRGRKMKFPSRGEVDENSGYINDVQDIEEGVRFTSFGASNLKGKGIKFPTFSAETEGYIPTVQSVTGQQPRDHSLSKGFKFPDIEDEQHQEEYSYVAKRNS